MTSENYTLLTCWTNIWPKINMDALPGMETELKMAVENGDAEQLASDFCEWLESQGFTFTVLKRTIENFVYEENLLLFRGQVLESWAERWIEEHLYGQTVMNDYLVSYLMDLEDALYEEENPDDEDDKDSGLWEAVENLWDALSKVECHIEIGTRMGMSATEIAVNDVLSGFFNETFDPRIIDIAKDLTQWVEANASKGKTFLKTNIKAELDRLCTEHEAILPDEDMALNYLCLDVIPAWINNNR